ncbi:hypothetical protein ACJX0J_017607, partial [Zea mays]
YNKNNISREKIKINVVLISSIIIAANWKDSSLFHKIQAEGHNRKFGERQNFCHIKEFKLEIKIEREDLLDEAFFFLILTLATKRTKWTGTLKERRYTNDKQSMQGESEHPFIMESMDKWAILWHVILPDELG